MKIIVSYMQAMDPVSKDTVIYETEKGETIETDTEKIRERLDWISSFSKKGKKILNLENLNIEIYQYSHWLLSELFMLNIPTLEIDFMGRNTLITQVFKLDRNDKNNIEGVKEKFRNHFNFISSNAKRTVDSKALEFFMQYIENHLQKQKKISFYIKAGALVATLMFSGIAIYFLWRK